MGAERLARFKSGYADLATQSSAIQEMGAGLRELE